MILENIKLRENSDNSQSWELMGVNFEQLNLVVGRNSTGKSRLLNIIAALSSFLKGRALPGSPASLEATFLEGESRMIYELSYSKRVVQSEKLIKDGVLLLERTSSGAGKILSEDLDGSSSHRDFQVEESQVAAFLKNDRIQHPFLTKLIEWARSIHFIHFGSDIGKSIYVHSSNITKNDEDFDENDALIIFNRFSTNKKFYNSLIKDMKSIGYPISAISIEKPRSFVIPEQVHGFDIQEEGATWITDQHSMSQGMFRAFASLIHINYCLLTKKSACLLIDDIGEGLDFARSCKLIKLLQSKTLGTDVQIVMTTNDQFIMDSIPLNHWKILHRDKSTVRSFDYSNSKDIFDNFDYSGLNNFAFFELELWKKNI